MRVKQHRGENGTHRIELLDEDGGPIEAVAEFLRFLTARDYS